MSTTARSPRLEPGIEDETSLDGFHAGRRPGSRPAGVNAGGQLIAVTDLNPGQFSRLDRFTSRHSSAPGSGGSGPRTRAPPVQINGGYFPRARAPARSRAYPGAARQVTPAASIPYRTAGLAGGRGLAGVLSYEFEPAPDVLASVLTCCDMTTSPTASPTGRQEARRDT